MELADRRASTGAQVSQPGFVRVAGESVWCLGTTQASGDGAATVGSVEVMAEVLSERSTDLSPSAWEGNPAGAAPKQETAVEAASCPHPHPPL